MFCCIVFCFVLLYCIASHRIALHCIALYCIVLYCIVLYCTVLHCTALHCTVLYCTVLYCTVLDWIGLDWIGLDWIGLDCMDWIVWIVWYCMVLYGMVWYCMVLYGIVWHCMVWYGMVWHCIALHCVTFIQYRIVSYRTVLYYVVESDGAVWRGLILISFYVVWCNVACKMIWEVNSTIFFLFIIYFWPTCLINKWIYKYKNLLLNNIVQTFLKSYSTKMRPQHMKQFVMIQVTFSCAIGRLACEITKLHLAKLLKIFRKYIAAFV